MGLAKAYLGLALLQLVVGVGLGVWMVSTGQDMTTLIDW